MAERSFTIGPHFGTGSVRAVVVDCADGRVLGTGVFDFPTGGGGVVGGGHGPVSFKHLTVPPKGIGVYLVGG